MSNFNYLGDNLKCLLPRVFQRKKITNIKSSTACAQRCEEEQSFKCKMFRYGPMYKSCFIYSNRCESGSNEKYKSGYKVYEMAPAPAAPVTAHAVAQPTGQAANQQLIDRIAELEAAAATKQKELEAAKIADQLHQLALGQDQDAILERLRKELQIAELRDQLASHSGSILLI